MTPGFNQSSDGFELAPLDDRPGPAKRISSAHAADMIRAAMDAAASVPVARPATPSRWRMAAIAAAIFAFGGVASAGIYRFVIAPPAEQSTPAPEPRRARAPVAVVEVLADAAPAADVDAAPIELDLELIVEARRPRPPAPREPEDLLQLANEQRKQRHWRQADEIYRRVLREHPRSEAAYVATVASASLQLEQLDDARAALRLYRRALSRQPGGALAEEARYGLAAAHRALGDADAEAQALRDFLDRHGRSALAERARRRLEALEP